MSKTTNGASANDPSQHPLRTRDVETLLDAFRLTEENDEIFDFLLDVATPRELADMASRLQVARLLADGMAYTAIEKGTGASATTIARVSKSLNYGQGYAVVLERLEGAQGMVAHEAGAEEI